jgi:hypothetical protein
MAIAGGTGVIVLSAVVISLAAFVFVVGGSYVVTRMD